MIHVTNEWKTDTEAVRFETSALLSYVIRSRFHIMFNVPYHKKKETGFEIPLIVQFIYIQALRFYVVG